MQGRLGLMIAAAAVAWPLFAGWSVWQRVSGSTSIATVAPYLIGSVLCHQRPERSFHTAGVVWPVCARCTGLYLGGSLGGAYLLARWRRGLRPNRYVLAVSAVPIAITIGIEWSGLAAVSNAVRAASGMPLGATVAFVLGALAARRESDQVN